MLRLLTALRANTSKTLVNRSNREICLKQCGKDNKTEVTLEDRINHTVNTIPPYNMLHLLLTPLHDQKLTFSMLFKVSPEKVPFEKIPKIHEVIKSIEKYADYDFNKLIEKLPNGNKNRLADALCHDIDSFMQLLKPLSDKNQRQVMDFIGWYRIAVLGAKDSVFAKESSSQHEFLVANETVNLALNRDNQDYLQKMRERDEPVKIAAKPGFTEC